MLAHLRCRFKRHSPELTTSRLYNEQTFYSAFTQDLNCCRNEVLIESALLTTKRVKTLLPVLRSAINRGVKITVNARHPQEHEGFLLAESYECITLLQDIGVDILFTGRLHRKLAIFDRYILWEGSLNILSQNDSCEVMRRSESGQLTAQVLEFTGLGIFL